ncbi:UNVERIFIED_CONTAM: hypothetical protein GTU68_055077 [Idotea baltica]|nr:hypothetical protein [Idotea baltica]
MNGHKTLMIPRISILYMMPMVQN